MFLVHTLPQQIWTACMFAVAAFAVWRGGWSERAVAFATIVGSITDGVVENRREWSGTQWGDLVVDLLYLAVVLFVALRSRRHWPMFAAAFQLVAVVIYFARMLDHRVGALAPFTAGVIWSYLILAAVVFGTWTHGKMQRTSLAASPSTGRSAT